MKSLLFISLLRGCLVVLKEKEPFMHLGMILRAAIHNDLIYAVFLIRYLIMYYYWQKVICTAA